MPYTIEKKMLKENTHIYVYMDSSIQNCNPERFLYTRQLISFKTGQEQIIFPIYELTE